MRGSIYAILAASGYLGVAPLAPKALTAQALQSGQFHGRVVVEWLEEDGPDRRMQLRETFEFQDANGKKWTVPEGAKIDGASIPRALWTIVGSPFTGDYRRASVVHDYYCVVKNERWEKVHYMFYEASLAGGVGPLEAKVLYAGVRAGGPRWEMRRVKGLEGEELNMLIPLPTSVSETELRDLKDWIEANNPTLGDIDLRIEQRPRSPRQ